MHSKRHFTGRLRFHSQKETVKIGQALENPVIAVAQGTGWVNAVLICDDFPDDDDELYSEPPPNRRRTEPAKEGEHEQQSKKPSDV